MGASMDLKTLDAPVRERGDLQEPEQAFQPLASR
jgi:hypothetical protein